MLFTNLENNFMDIQGIHSILLEEFGAAVVGSEIHPAIDPWIQVEASAIVEVAGFLRDDERLHRPVVTKLKRGIMTLLCAVMTGAAVGCSNTQPDIPDKFCQVPVENSSLSPLIPNGDSIKQKYVAAQSKPGAFCQLHVDGHQILFVEMMRWDREPEPTDWNKVGSQYKHAAKRKVTFPGYASIGSDHAIVQATCDTHAGYMSFVVNFSGDRTEDTPTGYKKLQRFINDFVPKETKKFDCTRA